MKQKLFIKIIALALCTAFVPVQAADVRQSATEDVFIVSGNSYDSYENVPIIILKPGVDMSEVSDLIATGGDVSDKILFTGTAVADSQGNLSYSIPVGGDATKNMWQAKRTRLVLSAMQTR